MNVEYSDRGFERVSIEDKFGNALNAYESSIIGDYEDSFERPGDSGIWINVVAPEGELPACLLNREQAHELGRRLIAWAETGSLKLEDE